MPDRLPRGRTYVRNGSVIDLQIERGKVAALVSGSEMYKVEIDIAVAGADALEGDLQGLPGLDRLPGRAAAGQAVEERDGTGLSRQPTACFPAPSEIKMSCSCPDWAGMCKHVAAVLYGVGARLDAKPELLFALRGVDHADLIADAGAGLPQTGAASERVLADVDVAALFGLDMAIPSPLRRHRSS